MARAQVPPLEKAICVVLLLLIPLAAWAVYRKGQRYDPHLYSLDPALVRAIARRAPAPGAGSADPGEDSAGAPPPVAAPGAPAALPGGFAAPNVPPSGLVAPAPALPALPAPAGAAPGTGAPAPGLAAATPASLLPPSFGDPAWAASGPVQRFRPDNLYEKIDGRAEQYLHYDVAGLETVSYADRKDPTRFLDAFVYDMGKPANAFGIYSVERPQGAKPVPLGEQGYRADASCFFTRGRYYVQVVASGRGRAFEEASLKLARYLDGVLTSMTSGAGAQAAPAPAAPQGGPGKPPAAAPAGAPSGSAPAPKAPGSGTPKPAARAREPEGPVASPAAMFALFPKEDAVPNSSQYVMKDGLGLDFLTDVYTMRYRVRGTDYTLFLTRRKSETEARALVDKYVDFLLQFGKVVDRRAQGPITFLVGEVSGYTDAVFRAGPFFGGANGAPDAEGAKTLALRLLRSLARGGARAGVPADAARIEQWPAAEAPAENEPQAEGSDDGE